MFLFTIISIIAVLLAALAGYAIGVRARGRVVPGEPHAQPSARALAPPAVPVPAAATLPASNGAATEIERVGSEKARIIRSRDAEAAMLRKNAAAGNASSASGGEPGRELKRLNTELADARQESARYRQLVVDIENNAPPPILSGVGEPDDLKLIVGIGPVLERMLHNLGVTTFRQIARWSERDSAEFDAKLPEFPGRIVRDQWVTQARELHQAKFGELPSDRPPRT